MPLSGPDSPVRCNEPGRFAGSPGGAPGPGDGGWGVATYSAGKLPGKRDPVLDVNDLHEIPFVAQVTSHSRG